MTSELRSQIALMQRRACTEDELSAMMDALEKRAEEDPDDACIMMADLWGLADRTYLHHVADSIDLWIIGNRSPAVVAKLMELSMRHADATVRAHWEGILSAK